MDYIRACRKLAPAILALLSVLGSAVVTAGTAGAASPGTNGKIAFASNRDDSAPGSCRPCNYEIYVMEPDGSGETRLTVNGAVDSSPAWSPNGGQIAFTSDRDGNREIYVMNADGSGETRLTTDGGADLQPAWSPDGMRIAFTSDRDGNREIYVMNADGSGETRLTTDGAADSQPTWAPDGSKVAFQRKTSGPAIYTVNATGGGETALTTDDSRAPDWSPDGSKLAFTRLLCCDGVDDYEIFVMNADGSGQSNLTGSSGDDGLPAWSPHGDMLAFYAFAGSTNLDIYTMAADGSQRSRLTAHHGVDYEPSWQPIPGMSSPSYDAPASASALGVSFVPNYRETTSGTQCEARGGAPSLHGVPLAFTSCDPPAYRPGTVARLGPKEDATAQFAVIHGDADPLNGDQANVSIWASFEDVLDMTGSDYDPNPSGADITMVSRLRVTDSQGGETGTEPVTLDDFNFAVPIDCVASPGPEGSSCTAGTTADSIVPGMIRESASMVIQAFDLRVADSGANEVRGDGDDRFFAKQGIYVP